MWLMSVEAADDGIQDYNDHCANKFSDATVLYESF